MPAPIEPMPLRDQIALQLLPVIYNQYIDMLTRTAGNYPDEWQLRLAEEAYELADAMMEVRRR